MEQCRISLDTRCYSKSKITKMTECYSVRYYIYSKKDIYHMYKFLIYISKFTHTHTLTHKYIMYIRTVYFFVCTYLRIYHTMILI